MHRPLLAFYRIHEKTIHVPVRDLECESSENLPYVVQSHLREAPLHDSLIEWVRAETWVTFLPPCRPPHFHPGSDNFVHRLNKATQGDERKQGLPIFQPFQ